MLPFLAALLTGAATVDRPESLDAESLMNAISLLTATELELARHIHDGVVGYDHGIITVVALPTGFPDVDFHLKRIEAAGLVEGRNPLGDYAPQTLSYFPTQTVKRLVTLLSAGGLDI